MTDPSNGYDAAAAAFVAARSRVGASQVLAWASSLQPGALVLDLGCGHGVPVTEALVAAGCRVHALDASPSLVEAFRVRFPDIPVTCAAAEAMSLPDLAYDGIVACGLLFLLAPATQGPVIATVSRALGPGGSFLFTAPAQVCTWADVLTGHISRSLGAGAYREILASVDLLLHAEFDDEGGNHYFAATKPTQ